MGVVTIMGNGIKQIFVSLFCSVLNGDITLYLYDDQNNQKKKLTVRKETDVFE